MHDPAEACAYHGHEPYFKLSLFFYIRLLNNYAWSEEMCKPCVLEVDYLPFSFCQVKEEDDAIVDRKLQIRLKRRRQQKKSKQVNFMTLILLFLLLDPELSDINFMSFANDMLLFVVFFFDFTCK